MNDLQTDDRAGVTAWLGVALFFVVGDLATTYTGFAVGAVEAHPTADAVIAAAGIVGVVAAKVFVVAVVWVFYHRARAYPTALPYTLAAYGIVITAWNTAVVTVLLLS